MLGQVKLKYIFFICLTTLPFSKKAFPREVACRKCVHFDYFSRCCGWGVLLKVKYVLDWTIWG